MSEPRARWIRLTTPFRAVSPATVITAGVAVWVIVMGAWLAITSGGVVSSMFLPSPQAVASAAVRLAADGTLFRHIGASLQVVLLGFVISSVLAVPVGLVMGSYAPVQVMLEPLVNFIRYLPVTSFVPLLILWIGIGIEQRVMVIFLGTFFQQIVMIADSARMVPRDLVNASYTLGTKRREVVWHIIFPSALPVILDTLRVTLGWAWSYVVVAEMVAASSGLGYITIKAMRGFQVDVIFLAVACIGLLGLASDLIFRALRKGLAPWST
ncbi:ABC transporter permease [Segnochrobactrum spirostomi]|uniref:ABC transporter permease n=1 Tax=Segnochrobactrum spirostomi TaxID=2608987 RepID=A0A6A7YB01_9HYPH|nr:ABC transporter permease [Segnochrobactrum spirostomi]MQT14842.1 ABC transporter permease [Segnochrobactrum spirostomi]